MKILIGSNGGLTGIYLAKHLSAIYEVELIGADSSDNSAGKFFVDRQYKLPSAHADDFLPSLIELINSEAIDIYMPTHSSETRIVSVNEEMLRRETDCFFMVSPKNTFLNLENKKIANYNLSVIGVPTPKVIEDFSTEYPIFMKKNFGSGSSGNMIIENSDIHHAFWKTYKDVSFYEMITGTEYTVYCVFDNSGILLGFNQRIREKTIGGAVSITCNDNCFDILPWILKISNSWKFCGCVNFQYILCSGIPYFIDINLRFPSGELPLTVESGLDIPKIMVDVMRGQQTSDNDIKKINVAKRMYRYFEEMYEDV